MGWLKIVLERNTKGVESKDYRLWLHNIYFGRVHRTNTPRTMAPTIHKKTPKYIHVPVIIKRESVSVSSLWIEEISIPSRLLANQMMLNSMMILNPINIHFTNFPNKVLVGVFVLEISLDWDGVFWNHCLDWLVNKKYKPRHWSVSWVELRTPTIPIEKK